MILRYLLAWIPMVAIAILNGILREATYGKVLSELRAHQLSTLTGICLFGFYIKWITDLWPLTSMPQAVLIGILWLTLTVIFEFSFGHYVAGHSWSHLFKDYHLLVGRVWLLVLIWVAIAPALFYRFL